VQQFKGPIAADKVYEIQEGQQEAKAVEVGVKVGSRAAK
jgi:hypothetical protein